MKLSAIGRYVLPALALVVLPVLAGCATRPTDPDDLEAYNEAHDPAEPTNREIYKFNQGLDMVLLKPFAEAYRAIAPQHLVREPIHRLLVNLDSPVVFANDVLQLKPKRAAATLERFILNSTVGIAGLFDVAASNGLKGHDADFGETLAVWGVPDGPFVELPLFGPSNPRDAVGKGVDYLLDPFTWDAGNRKWATEVNWTRFGLTAIDERERALDTLDAINKTSLDPYATLRSLYRQNRDSTIEQVKYTDQP